MLTSSEFLASLFGVFMIFQPVLGNLYVTGPESLVEYFGANKSKLFSPHWDTEKAGLEYQASGFCSLPFGESLKGEMVLGQIDQESCRMILEETPQQFPLFLMIRDKLGNCHPGQFLTNAQANRVPLLLVAPENELMTQQTGSKLFFFF